MSRKIMKGKGIQYDFWEEERYDKTVGWKNIDLRIQINENFVDKEDEFRLHNEIDKLKTLCETLINGGK